MCSDASLVLLGLATFAALCSLVLLAVAWRRLIAATEERRLAAAARAAAERRERVSLEVLGWLLARWRSG